ncbi:MAG: putative quinol monooxygenase [Rhodococcus sp. (in: high G+C Gram-positive bacteria)]|uniref:putative quinol monooxygenase n=1 Tax=Rhodococcus sp. TaxID=1831 RepID=UPI002ADAFE84|nr:putative quinol monooxygenase [Rhodococcus sp. (in: high G+C Gram-positive bacteria)]MDZ7928988.1 putative quinol monooxygenase [Rhodococcus sp. (in: high G+C Gram-positive bacteria)]
MSIRVAVSVETKAGLGDRQLDAFAALTPPVRAEARCLQYDLHRVVDSEERFVILEHWESAAALAAHDEAPHMRDADAANKAFRAGPAVMMEPVLRRL